MDTVALLQIVLTFIITVATVVYAVLTYILVQETRRLREVQTEPDVTVYLDITEQSSAGFDIVVKNLGNGAAYQLKWSFDQNSPLAQREHTGLGKLKFFEGIAYFAPGQVYRSFLGMGHELLNEPAPLALAISLSYRDRDAKEHRREFIIDPMPFYGRVRLDGHPSRDAADSLKKIDRHLGQALSGFRRIKVDYYDRDDREEERRSQNMYLGKKDKEEGIPDVRADNQNGENTASDANA